MKGRRIETVDMEKLLVPRNILICVVLVVLVAAGYWRAVENGFLNFYDDVLYVTENSHVQEGITLQSILWAFETGYGANWHPLTWLSHMLDCQIFGLNPWGHHLTNLLLHSANTLLLFLVLKRMTGSAWQSGFTAALFAVHPLHVESVAWIAERKDVLSTFFWMVAMLAYLRYVEQPGTRRFVIVGLMLALGLLAKAMLVTLPFVLLLLDYWPLGRLSVHSGTGDKKQSAKPLAFRISRTRLIDLIKEKIPLFVIVGISSVVTYIAQQRGGAMQTVESLPLKIRLANALVAYVQYIQKTIWPSGLAAFYPHPGTSLPMWQAGLAGIGILLVCYFVFRSARKFPYVTVGWLWYLGTLIPVIGLVQVGSQAIADRYMYVPQIGLSIALAWGVPEFLSRWPMRKYVLAFAGAALIISMTVITSVQVTYWRNTITLFDHALQVTSNNWLAHDNIGSALALEGRGQETIVHYTEALRIRPDYPEGLYNMGVALAGQGKTSEAMKYYEEAVRVKSDYAGAHLNLGVLLVEQGRNSEAMTHYYDALRVQPDYAEAHHNLGIALSNLGRTDEAVQRYREAIRLKPQLWSSHYNLAKILAQQGKTEEALHYFNEAVKLNPGFADIHYDLGRFLARLGRGSEAVPEYYEAVRVNPNHDGAHTALGEVLLGQGKIEEALGHFSEALRANPKNDQAQVNLAKLMSGGRTRSDARVHYNIGVGLAAQGKTSEAIAEFNTALQLKSDFAEVHNDLGAALGKVGRLDEAITHLAEAARIKPDFQDAHNNLGIALAIKGRTGDAIKELSEAVRLNPNHAGARYNLGLVLSKVGKLDSAIFQYTEALRIKPDYAEARSELERTLQLQKQSRSVPRSKL